MQDILGSQASLACCGVYFHDHPSAAKKWLVVLLASTTLLPGEIVPQCSIKSVPLGQIQEQFVAPYQETIVLPNVYLGKRNKLNIEAF